MTSPSKSMSKSKPITGKPDWTPVMRERFAQSEKLANEIWPFPLLTTEVMALDAIVGFENLPTRTPRAMFFAMALLYGDLGRTMFADCFPNMGGRAIYKDEWDSLMTIAPVNLDEATYAGAIAFTMAARRLHLEEPLPERLDFLHDLIGNARHNRFLWAKLIDDARRGVGGLSAIQIAPGWVRIEDPDMQETFKRVLRRNGREIEGPLTRLC